MFIKLESFAAGLPASLMDHWFTIGCPLIVAFGETHIIVPAVEDRRLCLVSFPSLISRQGLATQAQRSTQVALPCFLFDIYTQFARLVDTEVPGRLPNGQLEGRLLKFQIHCIVSCRPLPSLPGTLNRRRNLKHLCNKQQQQPSC